MPHPLLTGLLLALAPFDVDAGIITTDGQVVQGSLPSAEITMKTDFGTATIDTDALLSITFGADDVVTTRGESVLRGRLQLDEIELATDAGPESVERNKLRSLHVSRHAAIVPGEITDGTHWNASTYHIRPPRGYDPETTWPALVILHGTNTNSSMYMRAVCAKWPAICARYILIGINGTRPSEQKTSDQPQYMYDFVQFAGRSRHTPVRGAERQSPLLVAEVVADLKQRLPVGAVFLTGHSMGGYMTYSTFMNYPELFDGAMPVAGAMVDFSRAEAFTDKELRARQRAVPVAVVHATNDPICVFADAEKSIESMEGAGFEHVKLFSNDTAGHKFLLLPFDRGLAWLEELNGLR